jgi:hypothetical protein
VLATFLDVFPNATLWRGDFFARTPAAALIGWLGPPLWQSAVEERVRQLRQRGVEDRWVTEPAGLWMLYVGPLARLRQRLEGVPRNTDDRPRFEFQAARSSPEERQEFLTRGWPELVKRVMGPPRAPDPTFLGAPPQGPRWGELLARASREAVAQDHLAFRRTSREIRRVVPAGLLISPDPNAADAWPEPRRAGAGGRARPLSR